MIKSRRLIIKNAMLATIGAGFCLPEKWIQPVVNTVFVPARADMSGPNVTANDIRCLESLPIQIEFQLCNNSSTPVAIQSINSSDFSQESPNLPVTLSGNSCQAFLVRANSDTLDCNSRIRLSYNITSNGTNIVGGEVSLN